MKRIDVTSKELKKLNDLNQIIKKVYSRYVLIPEGFILQFKEFTATKVGGTHYYFYELMDKMYELIPEKKPVVLFSQEIFTTMRDKKKEMKGIVLDDDGNLYIEGEQLYQIGFIIKEPEPLLGEELKHAHELRGLLYTKMDNELVERMLVNDIIRLVVDKYRVRLVKTLIPNIKKDLDIFVGFQQNSEMEELFHVVLSAALMDYKLLSYHRYPCVNY